ncbi:hypothetical protein [Nocardioides zeae]
MFTVIGDVTGDGVRDLIAKDTAGKMWVLPTGVRRTGTTRQFVVGARKSVPGDFSAVVAMGGWGDVNADGKPDLLLRLSSGTLYLMPYNGGSARFGPVRGPLSGGARSARSAARATSWAVPRPTWSDASTTPST